MLVRGGRERLWWWLHPLRVTQQYRLASMAAWLSSTGIFHPNLLPHIPLIHLSSVNSSPCPEIAPQSLNPSSQPLHLPEDLRPCPGYVWLWQGLWFNLGCHRSAVSLSALNVAPLRQLSRCGDWTPASVPPPSEGRSSPTNTPVFPPVPSSYRVLCGSFSLVRYSCPLSAGVLHALLCLKVYSWCIHGETCTPPPLTPPRSC